MQPSIPICYSLGMTKLTAPRALTAFIARKVIRFSTIVAVLTVVGVGILCWVLAYFFTAWWWLLEIPFVLIFFIFLLIRLVAVVFVRAIHSQQLTPRQSAAMSDFVDKIQAALEARSMPLSLIVIICIKDILFHRDVTTVKKVINDTAGLRREYSELEKLF